MLKQKKAKSVKMRGSNSHGWGHKKKHRGKGHRGGVGLSGSGARGDAKKISVLAGSKSFFKILAAQKGMPISKLNKRYQHFGKKGFNHTKTYLTTISLSYIESNFDRLVEQGVITKKASEFIFDVEASGYDKLLGNGKFTKKLTVQAELISQGAKAKIEAAGGKVILADDFEEN